MRQIVLDTETTGLDPQMGHRIIEIGCVEMEHRRLTGHHYHQYINPEREVDAGAMEVHGISNEFLADKPTMKQVVEEFIDYVRGAELIIHNAPFDVGFINNELRLVGASVTDINEICTVFDTLALARKMHPGRRNTLDALCDRYFVDNSQRDLHGALLDSEILADVFIAMTSGQTNLQLSGQNNNEDGQADDNTIVRLSSDRPPLAVIMPNATELNRHQQWLKQHGDNAGPKLWPAEDYSETLQ